MAPTASRSTDEERATRRRLRLGLPRMSGPPMPRPTAPGRSLVAATTAMSVGSFALYCVSALAPALIDALDISRTQLGSVASLTFAVAALASRAAGGIVDRHGTGFAMRGIFLSGAISLAVMGAAPSYVVLLGGALFGGMSQALSNPTTNELVVRAMPPKRHGFAVGVKQSGVALGQFVAGVTLPRLAVLTSWRSALVGCALVVAFGSLVTSRSAPTRPAGRPIERGAGGHGVPIQARACALCAGVALQATLVYVPLFAFEVHGLGIVEAGWLGACLSLVGVVSRAAMGHLAGKIGSPPSLLLVVCTGMTAAMLLFALSVSTGLGIAWMATLLFASTGMASTAVLMASLVASRSRVLGAASGVLMRWVFVGFFAGPLLVGALIDARGWFAAWLFLAVVAALAAACCNAWRRSSHAAAAASRAPR